jgi:N-acetylmuramoyl-L-alanine amidase
MIDPGHGGHDPGAIGRSGTQEKDITLDVGRRIAAFFANSQTVKVKLTRDTDEFIPLPDRVRIGREARADLFVSIHADSAPTKMARGLSTYVLSEKASDNFAKALATQENRIEAMGGVDLGTSDQDVAAILMDLTARRTRDLSQRARYAFVKGVGESWQLLERPMRGANFAVLRSPDVPSFLVETGFLSNPTDESILAKPQQRQRIAQLMASELGQILNSPLFE